MSNNSKQIYAGLDFGEFWPFHDDFIFMMVMQAPEICTGFLRMVIPEEDFSEVRIRPQDNFLFTDPEVGNISMETQKTLKFHHDRHGVRLDALVKGTNQWAAIEMQTWVEPALGRRVRYYRGNMDLEQLTTGTDYRKLKKSYIIFICTYDPFGIDSPVYYFQSWDIKNNLNLGDSAFTIVLNTKCSPEKVPDGLKAFYEYMNDPAKSEGSQLVKEISWRVAKYNSPDWRVKRMRFEELRQEQYEKGKAAVTTLNKLLLEEGRMDDLRKSLDDMTFQQQLLEELGLSEKK